MAFGLYASDIGLAESLRTYLAPAFVPATASVYLHVGGAPAWNLPHTSTRHLERIHASEDGALTAQYDEDSRSWLIWDATVRRGLFWIDREVPCWHLAAPLRNLIHWALTPTPFAVAHAGSVGGLLFVGQGGSGKSTTVAACVQRGMQSCGDDIVVVGQGQVRGLYRVLKLEEERAKSLGFTKGQNVCSKKAFALWDSFSSQERVRAIVLPRITNAETSSFGPATASEALKALAPSTLFLLRGHETKTLDKLVQLTRSVPAFTLHLGKDPEEAAAVVQKFSEKQS